MKPIEIIMRTAPVIPVLVVDDAQHARPIAEALVAGGLRVLEVTLRTPAALDVIREMSAVDGAIVGAGTVLNEADLRASIDAGAKFIVSPGLTEQLGKAEISVLTEYRGLGMKQLSELRRTLKPQGGEYRVFKNTLVRIATNGAGIDADSMLTGPTGIAFVKGDAAAVAKTLRDYAKTNQNLVVKGGILGNRVLTGKEVESLADLPPRDVLLSQIAGLFEAPASQFASLLEAVPKSFLYGVQALIDKQEAAA